MNRSTKQRKPEFESSVKQLSVVVTVITVSSLNSTKPLRLHSCCPVFDCLAQK